MKLKRYSGLTDDQIAERTGISRQTVNKRLSGYTRIGLEDLEALAAAFEVPRDIFFMPPNDAIRWVMDREDAAAQAPAATNAEPIKSTKFGSLITLVPNAIDQPIAA